MERSVSFYRDKLGLKLRFSSSDWTGFDTGSTTLALHIADSPKETTSGIVGKHIPGTCTFSFTVENLEEKVKELEQKGVRFVMPPTLQPEGIKLAVCLDPDGLPISFTEFPNHSRVVTHYDELNGVVNIPESISIV